MMSAVDHQLAVFSALSRARNMTRAALARETGLSQDDLEQALTTLSGLGWILPSRDMPHAFRAVNGGYALASLLLEILDGSRLPDALDPLAGFHGAACAAATHRATFPPTYLSNSLDSFSTVVEEVLGVACRTIERDLALLHRVFQAGSRAELVHNATVSGLVQGRVR